MYIYICVTIYIYTHICPTRTFLWIPGLPTVDQSSPGRIDIPRSCRWCRSGQWLGCGQWRMHIMWYVPYLFVCTIYHWLVVYLPLWKKWKSVGIMTIPIYGKNKKWSKPPTRSYVCVCIYNLDVYMLQIYICIYILLIYIVHNIYCSYTLPFMALHCTTLPDIALHYFALQSITLQYHTTIVLHYIILHNI